MNTHLHGQASITTSNINGSGALEHFINILAEAAFSFDALNRFLDEFVDYFSLNACHLMLVNDKTLATLAHFLAGSPVSDEYAQSYLEKYINKDRVLNRAKRSTTGEAFATNLVEDSHRYYDSECYRDWAKPQGLGDAGSACVFVEGDWRCIMIFNRTIVQGEFHQYEINKIQSLLPSISKVIKSLYKQTQIDDTNFIESVINSYRVPALLLNEYGKIWSINHLMKELISSDNTLYLKDNALRIHNKTHDKLLISSILAVNKKLAGMDLPFNTKVDLDSGVILHIEGISKNTNHGFGGVLIFAMEKSIRKQVSKQKMMDMFALTESEASVCEYIMEDKELKEIAALRGKSVNTVREQLYQSFKKTNCNSQAQLVNLLSSIPVL